MQTRGAAAPPTVSEKLNSTEIDLINGLVLLWVTRVTASFFNNKKKTFLLNVFLKTHVNTAFIFS